MDDKSGEVLFGETPRSMRGGEVDPQFTPPDVKDEYWIHPESGLTYVSSPRRPVKAWHSGLISSFASLPKFVPSGESVARFFMKSFQTPKGYAYGVNRMWDMEGKLVSWEELEKKNKNFNLFGIPWFNADRFGVVQAPWIARAGWGDLDFLVEGFVKLFEKTRDERYMKVAEDLASPFLNYAQLHKWGEDSRRDFCLLVRSDPGVPLHYDQVYFWAHDAEGALYAYLKLADAEWDAAKAEKYRRIAWRLADLWLAIMDIRLHKGDAGWPPFWMYTLDQFLPGKPIVVIPRISEWLHESEDESKSQALGSSFFRIDHVPAGLAMAYLQSGEKKYLEAADRIIDWIHKQENFDSEHVALKRVTQPRRGFFAFHDVHSDSPYMRGSLIQTHALLAKAWKQAGDSKRSQWAAEQATKGIQALLKDRIRSEGGDFPRYSLASGEEIKLTKEIWRNPKYEGANLYNELYGYVYDYLFSALEILEKL